MTEGETDEIAEISEEDGDAWDSEIALERLRNAVFNDLSNSVPVHPLKLEKETFVSLRELTNCTR